MIKLSFGGIFRFSAPSMKNTTSEASQVSSPPASQGPIILAVPPNPWATKAGIVRQKRTFLPPEAAMDIIDNNIRNAWIELRRVA